MSLDPIAVLASMRLPDGRRWGEAATDWQLDDAQAVMGHEGPRSHYLTRPRGGSKTSDVAGIVAALLVTGVLGGDAHVFAADADQAGLLLGAARELVDRTPELRGLLRFEAARVNSVRHGGRLQVMAADGASAYGLRSELIVLDELAQWRETPSSQAVFEAALSTRQKTPGCRFIAITSAGSPDHFAFGLLEHARRSAEWRTSEVPGPLPWIDLRDLADQERLLPPSRYRQLHLNEWAAGEDSLASWEDVRACVRRPGPTVKPFPMASRYAVGLDIGLRNDRTVAAVMHRADDGARVTPGLSEAERIDEALGVLPPPGGWSSPVGDQRPVFVLDELHVWEPRRFRPVDLAEVETQLLRLAHKYGRYRLNIVFDPWQAAYLA